MSGLPAEGEGHGGPEGVAAEGHEFVEGNGAKAMVEELLGETGIDGPGPAEVDPDVGVVFGDGDEVFAEGVAGVHEHEACVGEGFQQFAEMAGPNVL